MQKSFLLKQSFLLKLIKTILILALIITLFSGCWNNSDQPETTKSGLPKLQLPVDAIALIRETNVELKELVGSSCISRLSLGSPAVDYWESGGQYPFMFYFRDVENMAEVLQQHETYDSETRFADGNIWPDDTQIIMVEANGIEQSSKLYGVDVPVTYQMIQESYPGQEITLDFLSKDSDYTLYETDVWVTAFRYGQYTISATFEKVDNEYIVITSSVFLR